MLNESIYDRMTKAEKEVAHMLKELGIQWSYERPLFIWDEYKRPRVWTPDFYLLHFGIYVEVCGTKNFDYAYRRKILTWNGYQVIFLHLYKDKSQWRKHLFDYLRFYSSCRNKKLNEILASSRSQTN
jgi:hypothetical protein